MSFFRLIESYNPTADTLIKLSLVRFLRKGKSIFGTPLESRVYYFLFDFLFIGR